MKRKAAFLMAAIAVVLAVLLATTVTRAKNPMITEEAVDWELTRVSMVSTGQVIPMDEGTFVKGMVVEARAQARGGSLVPSGTFRLTFDVFTPNRDMPGQRAGMNYVVGDWTLTQNGASPESAKARHSPDVVTGRIRAELAFNPAQEKQSWTAIATLPMSTAAGRWARGRGSFSLNADGTGSLSLDADLWPAIAPQQ